MSFFVTRPPRPVPETCETSTPCSEAIRATTGETNVFSPAPSLAWATGSGATVGAGSGSGSGSAATGSGSGSGSAATGSGSVGTGSGSGSGSAGGASAAPGGAITASFVPTSTVSPSCTRIC